MAISLAKNQTISLEKTAGGGLQQVRMGLGWDPVKAKGFLGRLLGGNGEVDLDASCIVLDGEKKPLEMVWFRQLESGDGFIRHSGDNRTGEGAGDDETIQVDLQHLPAAATYLVFTVNSFTGQSFESVANAYCRLIDQPSGNELARFDLAEKGGHTGVIMAYLSRSGGSWDFTAVGTATNGRTVEDLIGAAAQAVRG
ncbi:TerD family protein [Azomonas macrocytogenes]|uniref:Tellurium resistance protein TerZ n=1 Tax=Azomonas macrocytogenes TaxID=69962 RepID=A0A839T565_AZOMA|nr:TerD family protein [Azomonas macrocytogenes]MBB3104228.1 tellurium resistance protein TerZ [Azomonas macrocytogenes]